jgi:3-hydroxyisobutyrate dehydrogenase-like beta-hydroxyacid dehydrogenase
MHNHVGVVGLGNMGKEIAMRLAKQYKVFGYDIQNVSKEEVEKNGVIFSDLEKLASSAKIIFLSLPNASISKTICEEMIPYLTENHIIVETSTVLPRDVNELQKICQTTGVQVIDAAILGGVNHIKEGRAEFTVGGNESATISEISEYLLKLGKNVNVIGELGTGMAAKVINNGVAHNVMVLIIEAASIGKKLGIDSDKILEILQGETAFIRPLNFRYKELVQNNSYEGGMSTYNAQKDSTLILDLAQQLKVPLFSIQASQTVYDIAVSEQLGTLDYASIAKLWENWCDISFVKEQE